MLIRVVNLLDETFLKSVEKIVAKKTKRGNKFLRKPTRAVRIYKSRISPEDWKKQRRWEKRSKRDLKKRVKVSREEINRTYANRIPRRYEVYIKSKWWTERKNKYYQAHGRKCAVCNSSSYMNLHHIWYGGYGNEPDEQLIAFCHYHHEEFHKIYGTGTSDFRDQTSEFLESYGIRQE